MGQGFVTAAAVYEGLEEIGLRVVDRRRDPGNEREALHERTVDVLQFFRETDILIERIQMVFVIECRRCLGHYRILRPAPRWSFVIALDNRHIRRIY